MRCAVVLLKSDYEDSSVVNIPIQAMEVANPTEYVVGVSSKIEFTNPVDNTAYVKMFTDITENVYKRTILNNYSDCSYSKTQNKVIPNYVNPTNRVLTNFDQRYPLVSDQFLGSVSL